jgi:hypothetical protein
MPGMHYLKAAGAALAIIALGGQLLRVVEPLTWASHAVTIAALLLAGLAARRLLRSE